MATVHKGSISIYNTPTKTNTTTPTTSVGDSGISDKNTGGLLGGIGYLGEKLAVGAVQSIEGISDYAIGGIAKLFGFDKFAERQFRNDWFGDWYTHPDEWFNAGKGWKVAGDVFGGIGTSLPAILAATGVTIATAGAGAGAGAAILAKSGAVAGASFLTAGLGAAGNATKEAYQETGKLTGKEFGYGALTGTLEGGLEGVTNAIGIGTGAVVKSIAKNFSKEAFESAVRKGVGITLAESFFSEAFEEGASEAMSGKFKRATYDKNARDATREEIAYVSIVGGISGVLMGGAGSVFNVAQNTARGTQIVENGQSKQVLELAKAINDKADAENLGDIKQFKQVEATYKKLATSLEKTNGEVKTAYQRRLLGELKIDNVSAVFAPKMFNEAARIVNSADLIAKTYKGVDANGQPVSYTKEQLLEGVDLDNLRLSIPKALETNEALRSIVMSSMVGEMLMDTSAFQQAIMNGEVFAGEADLENFRKEAPDEQKREVEKVLGIDNIDTVDIATFNEKQQAFMDSPLYEQFFNLNKQMKARASHPVATPLSSETATTLSSEQSSEADTAQAPVENIAKPLDNDPGIRYAKTKAKYISYSAIGKSQVENVRTKLKQLYSDIDSGVATEIAIEDGDIVYIVDSGKENGRIDFGIRKKLTITDEKLRKEYIRRRNNDSVSEGNVSDGLSPKLKSEYDVNRGSNRRLQAGAELSADKGQSQDNKGRIPQDNGDTGRLTPDDNTAKLSKAMSVVESIKYANENIKEYKSLDTERQARVRRLIRQMSMNGFTDVQMKAYARVSARSGIDIVIDKEGLYLGKDKNTRADVYADGLYSPKRNKILVNPEGTRSPARLLIHELTHAIYKGKGRLILERGAKNLTKEQKEAIWNKYFPDTEFDESNIEFKDELNAHYTEALLDDDVLLQKLCDENPTLEDKIVAFLTGAKKAYADEPTLSREAKKLYKRYKTLFDSFAEGNQYADTKKQGEERYATSHDAKITQEMSDRERAEILKTRVITAPVYEGQADAVIAKKKAELQKQQELFGKSAVVEIAEKLSLINKKIDFDDVNVQILLSKSNIEESITKEATPEQIAKLLPILDRTARESIVIERHNNRYYHDTDTVYFDNLLGAYIDGDNLVPVRFGLKHSRTGNTTLYVVVNQNEISLKKLDEIKKDRGHSDPSPDFTESGNPLRSVKYSISQIFSFVNSKDLLRYIPDDFLNIDQKNIKDQAVRETEEYTNKKNNEKYSKYIEKGNYTSAKQMLSAKAKTEGYSSDFNWRMAHKAPNSHDDTAHSLDQIDKCYGDDGSIYSKNAIYYYGEGRDYDGKAIRVIQSAKNNPEKLIKIYRAVPADIKDTRVRNGDWVAIVKEYADEHGWRMYDDDYRIIENEVPAKHLYTNGDSINEFGYDNGNANEVYKNTKNNVKLAEITYDDEGNLIPFSQRYNDKDPDTRFALPDGVEVDDGKMSYKSIFGNMEKVDFDKEYYKDKADYWKSEYDKINGRDRLLGLLMSKAQKMKDLKLGTFANSTQFDSELFRNSIEKLARIQYRGNLNASGTRKIMGELLQWYRKNNPVLEYVDESNTGLYVQSVADMLESLSEGEKDFSKEELSTMYDVMSYFVKFVENYGKVFKKGKLVEAKPEAERYINIVKQNKSLDEKIKVGFFTKLSGSWYAEMFNDPAALVRRMDYYDNGFYTEMLEELRNAATDAEIAEMEIMRKYDNFLHENKGYMESASAEVVEYRGVKIPRIMLIDLYMTMKRKHAWAGIAINGFTFKNLEGKVVRVPGFVSDEHLTEAELEDAINAQRTEIARHFTDSDRKYMELLETAYNKEARKLKADRDIQRLGFTNATSDYYYPIKRAYTSQNIDTSDAQAEYDRVSNSSFNKDTVKGAKQEIALESTDARFRRHIHAVCQYSYLSPAVETFNRLYNFDIGGNKNKPESVRTASENTWTKGRNYFKKLISDIQGIPTGSSEGMAALSFIRGSYAKFQLGANPKVWFTQISSIFASSSILDADCISRGVALSAEGIDKYCPLAELRNYDNTAAMAQGVIDRQGKALSKTGKAASKVSKFSDLLMTPIGKMDRFVVCRLFGACQAQIEKNGGAKVGTEANKIEAGKLLKRVMLETQQNSIATERSAAMRSGNEILRTMTMFTSDSMKVIGRVIDAFGEISVLRAKIKAGVESKSTLEARLKVAKKNARKATTALVTTAVFMASIAQLFRWIYDKEQKDDETVVETMTVDAVGNLFGGLPIIKDVYARIFDGYGFDNYAYSSVNDILDSALNLIETSGKIIGGEATSQDIASGVKNLSYSVGQMTGLPVRNVYNILYGLTKRFSPETAYKIDGAFYKKNYQNDLYRAIERDDAEMASFILSLLYNERTGVSISEPVHSELYSLSSKGYKVIPKTAPDTASIDGNTYELNEAQKASVRKSYSAAGTSLEKLFANDEYKRLTDEMKAEAINYVYSVYYNSAIKDTLRADKGKVVLISSIIGAENLALLNVATKGITSDTDKQGKAISGSKRKKIVAAITAMKIPTEQKLLLIASKGYSLQDGDIRGMSGDTARKRLLNYILKLNISKEERIRLSEMCGFEVKNGKIILNK